MNELLHKKDNVWIPLIIGLSVAVPLVVLLLMLMPSEWRVDMGIGPRVLPLFHAVLNGTTAVLLFLGVVFIKNQRVMLHRASMMTAFGLSAVFLVSYVISKLNHDPVPFGGTGWQRPVYFFILISHIVLSAAVLPMAMMSIYRALTNELDKHRKWVKWTFPIWMYVAITGVLVYVFMAPYYV